MKLLVDWCAWFPKSLRLAFLASGGLLGVICLGVTPTALGAASAGGGVEVYPRLFEKCLQCHPKLQDDMASAQAHPPFQQGECVGCHDPHGADKPGLLRKDLDRRCKECHSDALEGIPQDALHTPVRQGDCQGCHQGHRSERPKLLKAQGGELCFSCHASLREPAPEGAYAHAAYTQGQCTDCHGAHRSFSASFAAGSSEGCTQCHDAEDKAFREAHGTLVDARSSCRDCHAPHTSTLRGLLRQGSHQPVQEGKCDACHKSADGTMTLKPSVGSGPGKVDCLQCHASVASAGKGAGGHVERLAGQCLLCHTPHASDANSLLKGEVKELCLGCHPQTRREMAFDSIHPPAQEGKCSACHSTHASEQPKLLRQEGQVLCRSCHLEDKHRLAHPSGKDWVDPKSGQRRDVIDPRTGKTLDCMSCHSPHGSPYDKLLTASGQRGLCLQCHSY